MSVENSHPLANPLESHRQRTAYTICTGPVVSDIASWEFLLKCYNEKHYFSSQQKANEKETGVVPGQNKMVSPVCPKYRGPRHVLVGGGCGITFCGFSLHQFWLIIRDSRKVRLPSTSQHRERWCKWLEEGRNGFYRHVKNGLCTEVYKESGYPGAGGGYWLYI